MADTGNNLLRLIGADGRVSRIAGLPPPYLNNSGTPTWALLAASPAAVLWGLAGGLIGPGPQLTLTGAIWAGAVLVFLVASLLATRPRPAP